MRILLVHPGADFSIADVATGLRSALVAAGHEIVSDYLITHRLRYHAAGMEAGGYDVGQHTLPLIAQQASENILVDALRYNAELVLIVSGLNVSPLGLWLLDRVQVPRIPVAVVLTESPYDDPQQYEWCSAHSDLTIFTHERSSARAYGWHYLPHAFDPSVHRPGIEPDPHACDVCVLGTGWPHRQELLEQIDWTGISLRVIGPWPDLGDEHTIKQFHEDRCVQNDEATRIYAAAKICLNIFRPGEGAESCNPRNYELAACGAFQLSDPRPELAEIFGEAVPTFTTAAEAERLIRYYLAHEQERRGLAWLAQERVQAHTFAARVDTILRAVRDGAARRETAGLLTTT